MVQWVVLNYPMLSPKVPTTLMTPYSYPMGHHSHSFVSKNGQKWLKNMFLMMLINLTYYSTHKYVLWDTNGVQLSHGITQGACYTQDSI